MQYLSIDAGLRAQADEAERAVQDLFAAIDKREEENTARVLEAFARHRVSATHFMPSTGYGYDDAGRDTLDQIWAEVFGCEAALVRHQFISGTHTIATALFGLLRPGDVMLSICGAPYDTLHKVIGIAPGGEGTLRDFGIGYADVALGADGHIDIAAVLTALKENPAIRLVLLQRSRGYDLRDAVPIEEMARVFAALRAFMAQSEREIYLVVDNCYGEFVQTREPGHVGADLMMGSLIKNPGAGIAQTGGYIAGRADLVERCAQRLGTPGIGSEAGASLGENKRMYQGLFMAPHTVAQALKAAVFAARFFTDLGFAVTPAYDAPRSDIVQIIALDTPEGMTQFCRGIQAGSAVDSHVVPEAWEMPGYEDPVIMASGSFVLGSSIEISADGPLRPPYVAYLQGGLTFKSAKIAIVKAAAMMKEKGLIR